MNAMKQLSICLLLGSLLLGVGVSFGLSAAKPVEKKTPITASHTNRSYPLGAVCDGLEPGSSLDQGMSRFSWWNHLGTKEWVQHTFDKSRRVSSTSVYWYANRGIQTPKSWRLLYLAGKEWKEVPGASVYGTEIDRYNKVTFTPLETRALRIEAQLKPKLSAGILEWKIESPADEPMAPVDESVCEMGKKVGDHKLNYILHTPGGPKPCDGWPLMLFLHGYGECGDDIKKVKKHGPPKLIEKIAALRGCVIVSPQCPKNSWWRTEALKALVDEVIADRGDIDTKRLYVTGLSMGGYGTWSFISRYPDYFAAAVPICGGGDPFALPSNRPGKKKGIKNEFDPEGLKRAKDLLTWAFHGTKDRSVPIKETEMLVKILKDAGSKKVKLTPYKDAGHVAAWQKAYNDPELWKWLFAQKRP